MSKKELIKNYRKMLAFLGEDPKRDGLIDTPKRIIKSLEELTWGLRTPEKKFLQSMARKFDYAHNQMISVRNIRFASVCEHHFLPFIGSATLAYIPRTNNGKGKIIGISKLARIVEYYAARPQVQERLTTQIADAIETLLHPVGVGVWMDATHTCMSIRGIKSVDASTVTSDLRGAMMDDSKTREEFLSLARSNTFISK